jgi:exosortase/archaeosortase family protein
MPIVFKETPDTFTVVKIWIAFVLISLGVFLLFVGKSYYTFDAFGIWILSCIALFYLSRQKIEYLKEKQKIRIIALGVGICILSFASIPLGISRPPYSIGEYSVLLSGIGLILFGALRIKSLLLPVSIPCIAVIGYDGYRLFLEYADKATAPLIPFTVSLTTTLLNSIGIRTITDGDVISFLSQNGHPIYLRIIGECTGVVSLGTFTIALIIVITTFPQSITRKSIGLIVIGYIGTYCANIGRIVLIALSGYYFGPQGVIEQVHIHLGWILFSLWMIIFWYYFFTRHLGFSIMKKRNQAKGNENNNLEENK